ncbi:MAG TPA: NAD-dependent epimerase/dehydratase family protein [Verrucomicrobiae bacterium]|nr:NAD-dependent epimerase/dehydratase family protein [Verrucomicrobiae bacterium]
MRVLIVGCGYIGLPLGAELVRQGHTVFGLRRTADDAELKAAGITPLRADITRAETLIDLPRDFDWVVNCAASGGGDAEAYRQLYLEGNRNLIKWLTGSAAISAASSGGVSPPGETRGGTPRELAGEDARATTMRLKKFIYTSSTSVYGQNDGSLVTETDPVSPATETGRILVAAENLLLAAAMSAGSAGVSPASSMGTRSLPAGRQRPQGDWKKGSPGHSPHEFPVMILRLAGIYGPGRGHWFKQFLRGEARLEGDGSRFLNMVHGDDVVGAIIAALESDVQLPSVFNVVDDEPVMQRDFFAWLAGQLGKPMPPSVPTDAETNRKRGVTNKRVSNQRLKRGLGYQFKYPTFREGYAVEIGRMDQTAKRPIRE